MCVGVCKGIWRDRDLGCCSALAANGASKQANRQSSNQAGFGNRLNALDCDV